MTVNPLRKWSVLDALMRRLTIVGEATTSVPSSVVAGSKELVAFAHILLARCFDAQANHSWRGDRISAQQCCSRVKGVGSFRTHLACQQEPVKSHHKGRTEYTLVIVCLMYGLVQRCLEGFEDLYGDGEP